MKEKTFRAVIAVLCLLALLGGILLLGELVTPVWGDDPLWEPATYIMEGFYAEPENSVDVLFLGSSHVFCGVNPLSVYEASGLRSYDLASGMQRTWISYHYLLEALKTQSPAVVVLDTAMLTEDSKNEEGRNRMALDDMKSSPNKWEAVRVSLNEEAGETMLSYYLPLFRFHDRILELDRSDFSRREPYNPLHGYRLAYMDKITPVTPLVYDPAVCAPAQLWEEGSPALAYLEKLRLLCEERGIRLVLITTPVTGDWSGEQSAAVSAYAEDRGVTYRDFNLSHAEAGLDPERDFYDADHLNVTGADKFSRYLGGWLREEFFPEAPEADPRWEEDLRPFREEHPAP